ncbi:MAG: DUF3987 domain-containing protein, partial [Solirubrobacteraceae bacterium]
MLGSALYRGQGWLARWLIAAPVSLAGTRLHDSTRPAPADDPRIRRYWHALAQLLAQPPIEDHDVGGLDPPVLMLAEEARVLLIAAYDEIERAQARDAELEAARDWAGKAAEHACRIAGVMTMAADPAARLITGETMTGALALTEHYLGEFRRLVGAAGIPEHIAQAQRLLEWLVRRRQATVTATDVMQRGPGRAIRSADAARAALHTLAEHGWLSTQDGRTYAKHPDAPTGGLSWPSGCAASTRSRVMIPRAVLRLKRLKRLMAAARSPGH